MHARLALALACLVACEGPSGHATEGENDASTTAEQPADTDTTDDSTTMASTGAEAFAYEGEHVVVVADPSRELCAGTIEHMDTYIERLAAHMGFELPVFERRIRFEWVNDEQTLADRCGFSDPAAGCTRKDGVIFALQAPLNHEFVHSLAFGLPGNPRPAPFFTEGLANAHEGYGAYPMPPYYYTYSDADIDDLVQQSAHELGNPGYQIAGRFAARLAATHGISKYLDLYTRLDAAVKDPDKIDAAFMSALGTTFAAEVAAFSPPWTTDNYDPLLSECGAPDVPWDGELLRMEEFLSCGEDRAIGPYDGDKLVLDYTIDIPVSGGYELRIEGDDQASTIIPDIDLASRFVGVSIAPCTPGMGGFMETRMNGTPRRGYLSAGRHSLRLLGSITLPWYLVFTLKRIE
jgi:hypothetical protein